MASLKSIVDYSNTLLGIDQFRDYCPNGLQVEGKAEVKCLVGGVTASLALVEAAIATHADAIIVHHGYFWKGEATVITGMKKHRLTKLLSNNISLLAYHLPLDAHPELGNNAQLAKVLGFSITDRFGVGEGVALGCVGEISPPLSPAAFAEHLQQRLGRSPQHIAGTRPTIARVAWCTGAAQDYLESAAKLGVDAFISGEISEQTVHIAHEMDIHYFAAGHHATERYGIQALCQHLGEHFAINAQFIDIDNPV